MQADAFRVLVEYMCDMQRRDRDNHPIREHPAFDTTVKDDSNWDQRY
jgi:hypothetical protein